MRRAFALWATLAFGCSSSVLVLESQTPTTDGGTPTDAATPGPDASMPRDASGPLPLVDLALGAAFDHTCAAAGGQAFCWGLNDDAQLGLGDATPRLSPERVSIADYVLATCAGETHGCALGRNGTLFCWGKNLHGELGLGDFKPRSEPAAIAGTSFSRIACGGASTCGIRSDGALFCWGDNFEGKVGQDDAFTSDDVPKPTRVLPEQEFRDVSVGQGHVCAVDRAGALFCWGRNNSGQLGLGMDSAQVRRPSRVGTASDYRVVAAAQHHTCAVRRDSSLECWGAVGEGELGIGMAAPDTLVTSPMKVSGTQGYRSVRANWFHTCALGDEGSLWCWGRNTEGQLGLGDQAARDVPTRVGNANTWREVTAGHFHTCAFGADGLWCWGENSEAGQLGIGEVGRQNSPTKVPIP